MSTEIVSASEILSWPNSTFTLDVLFSIGKLIESWLYTGTPQIPLYNKLPLLVLFVLSNNQISTGLLNISWVKNISDIFAWFKSTSFIEKPPTDETWVLISILSDILISDCKEPNTSTFALASSSYTVQSSLLK